MWDGKVKCLPQIISLWSLDSPKRFPTQYLGMFLFVWENFPSISKNQLWKKIQKWKKSYLNLEKSIENVKISHPISPLIPSFGARSNFRWVKIAISSWVFYTYQLSSEENRTIILIRAKNFSFANQSLAQFFMKLLGPGYCKLELWISFEFHF